jgi:cell division protein FtsW
MIRKTYHKKGRSTRRGRENLKGLHKPDFTLLTAGAVLLAFGVLMVYDASVVSSLNLFGGQYHYLLLQLIWVLIGLLPFAFLYLLDYKKLRVIAFPFFLISFIFLAFVLFPTSFSPEVLGSRRWVYLNPSPLPEIPLLGRLRFQPSELAKLGLVLYLAALFTSPSAKNGGRKRLGPRKSGNRKKIGLVLLLPLLVLTAVPVLLEPDLGTTIILVGIGITVYFVAGGSFLQLALFMPLLLAAVVALIFISPYRSERLLTYLNPSLADPRGAGYQIRQILIALGSGGLFGLGIGESRQKYAYLPGVNTDSIFAVVGEEFGFVGTVALILLYWVVVYRGFKVAQRAPDQFGRVLSAGIAAWFALQAFVNLGAMVGITPLTGVTLPFISYGGSSLVVMLAAFGVLLNISRQTVRK